MEIGIILGILGIIATIILGAFGIYYSKHIKSISNISFICHTIIPIFSTLQKRFDKIKIQYSNKPISENLVYCKFSLINTSYSDIDKKTVYKPFEIEFPLNHNIFECLVSKKSTEDINANITVRENKAIINWDLLKANEYISFDLFVDIPKDAAPLTVYNYSKKLRFNYRIANLNKINLLDYKDIKPVTKSKMLLKSIPYYISFLFFFALGITSLISGIKSFIVPKVKVTHEMSFKPTGEKISEIKANGDRFILFENNNIVDSINSENVKELLVLSPKLKIEKNDYGSTFAGLFISGFFLIGLYLFTKETVSDFKMNNILNKINKEK